MKRHISEADLHAYADNQLDVARSIQVEAWLVSHPEEQKRIEQWRAHSTKFHRAYDAVLDCPVPTNLVPSEPIAHRFQFRRLAFLVWLIVGCFAGYVFRGTEASPDSVTLAQGSLPRMAAVAHAVYTPEVRHPVEVPAEQEAHLIAWLSKRLGSTLTLPELTSAGYALVGGRLLPGTKGSVAQFMYEDNQHQRLTLYIQPKLPTAQAAAFRYAQEEGIDVFYWVEGDFGYALSGNVGRENMLRLATLVYKQL
ncbi:anti-sigma factor family protein [Pusillimonas minor]|uniref:Anti-sigma factor n=1 Tax=Pusillimonas minor TaxID=2697024 RepID=A0A842HLE2_9BURK|nr:anti-sigma factor [Pusillimonas minor]MBC2768338.1 anti-sigma factor [Pusillimonas minor]